MNSDIYMIKIIVNKAKVVRKYDWTVLNKYKYSLFKNDMLKEYTKYLAKFIKSMNEGEERSMTSV